MRARFQQLRVMGYLAAELDLELQVRKRQYLDVRFLLRIIPSFDGTSNLGGRILHASDSDGSAAARMWQRHTVESNTVFYAQGQLITARNV